VHKKTGAEPGLRALSVLSQRQASRILIRLGRSASCTKPTPKKRTEAEGIFLDGGRGLPGRCYRASGKYLAGMTDVAFEHGGRLRNIIGMGYRDVGALIRWAPGKGGHGKYNGFGPRPAGAALYVIAFLRIGGLRTVSAAACLCQDTP
jgi:hypothetical protein